MPPTSSRTYPQAADSELLSLFPQNQQDVAAPIIDTLKRSIEPSAYHLVKLAIEIIPERQRMRVLGYAMDVSDHPDEVAQIRRAWEIYDSAKFDNLSELIPTLRPEDKSLNTMPPDPITLLGQEGLHALNGLSRFLLQEAYRRAPEEQKFLFWSRAYHLLGASGALRQLLGAIRIFYQAHRAYWTSRLGRH